MRYGAPQISRRFKVALKLDERPAYRIAGLAGIDPTALSKLINGLEAVRRDDPRVIAVGAVLGLSADRCFTRTRSRARIEAAR